MGVPRFAPGDIPFVGGTATRSIRAARRRRRDGRDHACVSMGNPHAVQVVADVDARAGGDAGPADRAPPALSRSASNAGYMQVVDRATIRLRVWERGAGETLACGTGACAAVVGRHPARPARFARCASRRAAAC